MSRINTNVQSLLAQRVLNQNNNDLSTSLSRLSTGLRINRGADDPAGLIASENLRAELGATNAAISNAERADQVVNIAEGGLQEVSSLLTELQGLLTQAANDAGFSREEKEANQLQVDSILQTIDRIAGSTNFQGTKLLNGNFDYTTDNVSTNVDSFRINGAKFDGTSQEVNVNVSQSAQRGGLYLSFGGTSLNLQGSSGSAFTVEVSGSLGARELSFSSSTSLSDIASTINTFSEVTGVEATASSTGIILRSEEYGSDEFVSVKVVTDAGAQTGQLGLYNFDAGDETSVNTTRTQTFAAAENGVRDEGQNVAATVNGIAATSNGRDIKVSSDYLDIALSLDATQSQTLQNFKAFDVTGGGADFQMSAEVNIGGKVSIGIGNISSRKVGETSDGNGGFYFLDDLGSGKGLNVVDGDLTNAQKVVEAAIGEISAQRGRLGAFQKNVVGGTIRSLQISAENTAAAESQIRDADFASETAALTRNQILVSAATNTLSLANSQPQQVLQLLG